MYFAELFAKTASLPWLKLLLVGGGGFVGAIARFVTTGAIYRAVPAAYFPFGTLVVNIVGSFLIGLLAGLVDTRMFWNEEVRALIFIGVLGSFTTFSTFSYETVTLFQSSPLKSGFNIAAHLVLCLGAAWCGRLFFPAS